MTNEEETQLLNEFGQLLKDYRTDCFVGICQQDNDCLKGHCIVEQRVKEKMKKYQPKSDWKEGF